MIDAAIIFPENALVLLKESTEIRIIVVIGHRWWMTCLSDSFGANEPTFLAFAHNFHTHQTPEQKGRFQVSGGATRPHEISGIGYPVYTRISPEKLGIGCGVSLRCKTLHVTFTAAVIINLCFMLLVSSAKVDCCYCFDLYLLFILLQSI
jgi:hypothetical protein